MSEHLPSEIVTEILLRLPVKSLLRFRCVSKSWNSLIINSDFVSKHTNHTFNKNSIPKMLVRYYSCTEKREKYAIHWDNSEFSEYRKIESPLICNPEYRFYIVGSVNGLVCLYTGFTCFILWNPAIEKCLTYRIPHKDCFTDCALRHVVLGFGFDCKSNDYKVVKFGYYLSCDERKLVSNGVEIFELKMNAWRGIRAVPPTCRNYKGAPRAFVNGVVHWVAYCGIENNVCKLIIITFDMSEEIFGEMEMADGINGVVDGILLVFGQSLCYVYNERHDGRKRCCIWVMKEYGVKESWTKFTVDMEGQIRCTLRVRKNVELIQFTGDGELVSFDFLSQRISSLGIMSSRYTTSAEAYVETLALLDKPNEVWEQYNHIFNEDAVWGRRGYFWS